MDLRSKVVPVFSSRYEISSLFLSMHSDMKIVLQQWLSTVIFYLAYSRLGIIGLSIVLYICFACICVLSYKTILLITGNELVSAVLAAVIDILLFNPFIVTRPQVFTYVILLFEIYLLEKHAQTKKYKYLIGIPLLSLAQINLHASMWPMMFVFMLPYIAGAIPVKIKSFKLEANGIKALAVAKYHAVILYSGEAARNALIHKEPCKAVYRDLTVKGSVKGDPFRILKSLQKFLVTYRGNEFRKALIYGR